MKRKSIGDIANVSVVEIAFVDDVIMKVGDLSGITNVGLKKDRERFIKRIIAAVLVFLAPILINLILDLANNVWNWINPETCIK